MTLALADALVIERDFLRTVDLSSGYLECIDALFRTISASCSPVLPFSFHYVWSNTLCIFEHTPQGAHYAESDVLEHTVGGRFFADPDAVSADACAVFCACAVWTVEEKRRRDAVALINQRKAYYSLVGLVIHNIKNPVSGISGFAQLLQVKATDATMQEYCQ